MGLKHSTTRHRDKSKKQKNNDDRSSKTPALTEVCLPTNNKSDVERQRSVSPSLSTTKHSEDGGLLEGSNKSLVDVSFSNSVSSLFIPQTLNVGSEKSSSSAVNEAIQGENEQTSAVGQNSCATVQYNCIEFKEIPGSLSNSELLKTCMTQENSFNTCEIKPKSSLLLKPEHLTEHSLSAAPTSYQSDPSVGSQVTQHMAVNLNLVNAIGESNDLNNLTESVLPWQTCVYPRVTDHKIDIEYGMIPVNGDNSKPLHSHVTNRKIDVEYGMMRANGDNICKPLHQYTSCNQELGPAVVIHDGLQQFNSTIFIEPRLNQQINPCKPSSRFSDTVSPIPNRNSGFIEEQLNEVLQKLINIDCVLNSDTISSNRKILLMNQINMIVVNLSNIRTTLNDKNLPNFEVVTENKAVAALPLVDTRCNRAGPDNDSSFSDSTMNEVSLTNVIDKASMRKCLKEFNSHIINHKSGVEDMFFCVICKIRISGFKSVIEHVRGKKHHIILKNEKWYCKICETYIPLSRPNLFQHVNGTRHMNSCKTANP